MIGLELPAPFTDNVGQFLSPAELNMLIQNGILLDQLSHRFAPALDSSAQSDAGGAADLHPASDYKMWWGSGIWRAGMTSLVITGAATSFGSTTLKVYVNGVLKATVTPSASWSTTISVSSGYADGDFLSVDILTFGNVTDTSTFIITDAYLTPLVVSSSWPGVPSFSGTYNAGKFNQLIDACVNLWERINVVPLPAGLGHVWAPANHKISTHSLYHGAISRNFSNDILRIYGSVLINNAAEYYTVALNGSIVHTSPTYSPGTYAIAPSPISLTAYTIGARVQVAIKAVVTSAVNQDPDATQSSRYTLNAIRTEADSSGYPVASPPTEFATNTSIASSTIDSRLNAIATMLTNVNTRLNALPELWNRSRLVRRRFAIDDRQNVKLQRRYVHRLVRRGDKLVVRGKGIRLGWGGYALENSEGVDPYSVYKFAHEESLVDGEHYQTATVYLDSLEGLFPGSPYYIAGYDVVGAWEYISS
jgi:hypothetical protein